MKTNVGISREEHLAWCKNRALELLGQGDLTQAYASMASDLGKHDGTAGHPAIKLGMMLMMRGHLSTDSEMRKFILGFN